MLAQLETWCTLCIHILISITRLSYYVPVKSWPHSLESNKGDTSILKGIPDYALYYQGFDLRLARYSDVDWDIDLNKCKSIFSRWHHVLEEWKAIIYSIIHHGVVVY